MARWRRDSWADVPEHVRGYRPKLHGAGDEGIDRWRREATAWLLANPGRTLPIGGYLDVMRLAVQLKLAELGQ